MNNLHQNNIHLIKHVNKTNHNHQILVATRFKAYENAILYLPLTKYLLKNKL